MDTTCAEAYMRLPSWQLKGFTARIGNATGTGQAWQAGGAQAPLQRARQLIDAILCCVDKT